METKVLTPAIDIRPDHWRIVQDILRRHVPQYEVWAFGSRAKWTAKEYSDLDLAVITDHPLPLSVSAALADDFSESDLPWKVDVVDWATTRESFRKIIERDRVVVQKKNGVMDAWPIVRLGDYIEASLGKMLDAQKNKGIPKPYLGNSNVRWGRFDLSDLALMKFEEDEDERYGIRDGDLIVCEGGEPGRCAIWREEIPDMKIQKALHRIRSKDGLNSSYLFYWLMLAGHTGRLEPYFTGTTIKHLTGKALSALELPLPPIEEQRAIAHILGTLDDKIELNRRMNETLEAMARALFKSWFVDFDGVAPQDMQQSELGLIPKGWRVASLSEVLEIIGGGTPKTTVAEYWGGNIPWFSVVDTPIASNVFVIETEKNITQMGLLESSVRLIPKGTTIISARGTVGNLAMAGCDMTFNQSCYGLRGKNGAGDCFAFLVAQQMVNQLRSMAHGSVFSTITRETFDAIRIPMPHEKLIKQFEYTASVWFNKILMNVQQSKILAQLRDTLLPKLISGQLRVNSAEMTP